MIYLLSDEVFDLIAAYLTPASLTACMMVSNIVRAFTSRHYEPRFIMDYELQQSKWSTAFTRDCKMILGELRADFRFSANALPLLHLACEHYVYDVTAQNIRPSRWPTYMIDRTPDSDDSDYHPDF
jgi:hypothetical protein